MAEEPGSGSAAATETPSTGSGAAPAETPSQNGNGAGTGEAFTTSVDPNTLAPELQKIYKGFQADYTRKTQSLAEERRKLEEERQAWLAEQASGGSPVATPVSDASSVDDTQAQLQQFVDHRARQIVADEMRPIRLQQAEEQITSMKTKFGDVFTTNIPKIRQVLERSKDAQGRPMLSLEEAFRVAAGDELVKWGETKAYNELKAKGNTVPSLTPGPSTATTSAKDKPTLKEAMERSKSRHGLS